MPRQVLLVDDDIAEIALVKRALERGRHEARVATNVSDAWAELARAAPEVVLLAPECDGGEGAEVAVRLAGQPGARAVALVLLGSAVEGVQARVVARPLDARELEEALEQAAAPTAAPTATPTATSTPTSTPTATSTPTSTPTSTSTSTPTSTALPRLAFDRSPSRFEEASELRAAERELWLAQERQRRVPPPLERPLVEEKLRVVQRADYFDVLGVEAGCSTEEIRLAVARLLAELTVERCPADDSLLRGQVEEIRSVVSDAGAVLGDEGLRAEYRRAVGR
ncbi:MAG TPA: hypothetical protein VF400_15910 [Anaeromyxobacteraceae bacterium]